MRDVLLPLVGLGYTIVALWAVLAAFKLGYRAGSREPLDPTPAEPEPVEFEALAQMDSREDESSAWTEE